MSNHEKHRNNNQGVSEKIKNTAGAAFHAVHSGLEKTEDAAMNAVDATADAISNLRADENNRRGTRDEE